MRESPRSINHCAFRTVQMKHVYADESAPGSVYAECIYFGNKTLLEMAGKRLMKIHSAAARNFRTCWADRSPVCFCNDRSGKTFTPPVNYSVRRVMIMKFAYFSNKRNNNSTHSIPNFDVNFDVFLLFNTVFKNVLVCIFQKTFVLNIYFYFFKNTIYFHKCV